MNKINILKKETDNTSVYYIPTYYGMNDKEIIKQINEKIGVFTSTITQEQYTFTKSLLIDGWTLCNCFYGEKSKDNKNISQLKIKPNWFKYTGINPKMSKSKQIDDELEIIDSVSDYVLHVNYDNGTIYLYDCTLSVPELISTYHCYDDIKRSLKHLQYCVPAVAYTYINIIEETDVNYNKNEKLKEIGNIYYKIDMNRMKEISEEKILENKEQYQILSYNL